MRAYLNLKTHQPITTTQTGDLLEVRLTVKVPAESWYLAIEDPLPGGLAAVNERLNTTRYLARRDAYNEQNDEFRDARYGYNQKEMRDELTLGAAHGHTSIILGAWGCGAFGNAGHEIAALFDRALKTDFRGVYDRAVFAVLDFSAEQRFIGLFQAVFG